ncbi:uncharacterized protein LOC113850883 [Abrus precatorius]|uniref:Uncharacterized protein LOC113850883 n=1 Tax=Abrus precatorius TaxID=3816 RepID=A0A8B8K178_ABRPR|nr:uncharacterized protein LOC113850883 [Abrus precatorius]
MTVGEYAAKFQKLMKYWPHYQHGDGEEDLCTQFEHGLRPDIRAVVSMFQLTDLPTMVSKSRIFEANSRGKTVDTRCGGPYMVKDCPQSRITCNNCGKLRHIANKCWAAKRNGSASVAQRPESRGSTGPSTGQKPSIPGRVFAMSEAEASQSEELIRGKCIIKGRLLDVLFDSSATHSFISVDCMKSLGLYVTELPCNVMATTPTGKPIVMSWGEDFDLRCENGRGSKAYELGSVGEHGKRQGFHGYVLNGNRKVWWNQTIFQW